METVLLSKMNLEETKLDLEKIKSDLEEIKTHIKNTNNPSEHFIDNNTFAKFMGVSTRTAQTWRDQGLIGFSKPRQKIYYRMSDIYQFLKDHHQKPSATPSNLV